VLFGLGLLPLKFRFGLRRPFYAGFKNMGPAMARISPLNIDTLEMDRAPWETLPKTL
jgi:hypothetical protein